MNYLKKYNQSVILRYWVNWMLWRKIPFNRPHGIWLESVEENEVCFKLPYKKANLNHIKTLHACALATLAEYTSGFMLFVKLGKGFRLVMKSIQVEYHLRGTSSAFATYKLNDLDIETHIKSKLAKMDAVEFESVVDVKNEKSEILCTAKIKWQIKAWEKVKMV